MVFASTASAMTDVRPAAVRFYDAGERKAASAVHPFVINDEKTAAAVLTAFNEARGAGLESPECYRAGVEVWRRRHPDHTPGYAAKQAVAVILAALGPELLKIE